MKAYYLLVPLCVALLGGCAVYQPVAYTTPATLAYVSPTYVSPTYVSTAYVSPAYFAPPYVFEAP